MENIIQAPTLSSTQVMSLVEKFRGRKVLVIGDIGIDEYLLGDVRRISPEAPVPVLEVETQENRLGLAANVAFNVRTLGGEPLLVGLVGKDSGAELIKDLMQKSDLGTEHLVLDESRPTTRKTRVMAKHHHLVRVDFENRKFVDTTVENKIFDRVAALLPQVDVVVVEDYAKGMISSVLLKKIVQICQSQGKKLLVDPHRTNNASFYEGVDLLKPNFDESVAMSGLNYDELRDHPNRVLEVGRALMKKSGAKELVMTRGKDGMMIFSNSQVVSVPTYARQVFDVTGAGDTVIAALSLGVAAGLDLTQSCLIANYAAGVVVGQVGCVPCRVDDLRAYITRTGEFAK